MQNMSYGITWNKTLTDKCEFKEQDIYGNDILNSEHDDEAGKNMDTDTIIWKSPPNIIDNSVCRIENNIKGIVVGLSTWGYKIINRIEELYYNYGPR